MITDFQGQRTNRFNHSIGRYVGAVVRRLPTTLIWRLPPRIRALGRGVPVGEQPTFSIVIPIYDSPLGYLRSQLDSIRDQTYPHFECVVIDDGSPTPFAVEVAESFAKDDTRFRVLRRADNGGIARATNLGLDAARNDWIVFGDHDDRLRPNALAAIATHILDHPDVDVLYTDECLIDGNDEPICAYRKPHYSHHRFIAMNYFCHIVTMRRTLVEKIGRLDPEMEPSADRDFNFRAVERARSVGHIADILYEWRAIEGSTAEDLDAKPRVKESTLAGAQGHLRRTNPTARARPAPYHPYLIQVERSVPEITLATVIWDDSTTLDELEAKTPDPSDQLLFIHRSVAETRSIEPLLALAAEPDVGATAPRLTTSDGRLVSGGHIHHPALMEVDPGRLPEEPGPWGVHLTDHEVASADPDLIVFDRTAWDAVGGFDLSKLVHSLYPETKAQLREELVGEFRIDLLTAIVCLRLWQRGTPVVWSPLVSVVVGEHRLDWPRDLRRRAASRRIGRLLPDLLLDPYSPIETR